MPIVTTGELTIVDSNDGINARLTNESFVAPADTDGTGSDFSGCATTMSVFLGRMDDTANWSFSASATVGIVGSLVGSTYTVTGMATDVGFVDITASRIGHQSITSRFSVAKAKRGQQGPVIIVIASAAGFTFVDDVAQPAAQSIAFTVVRQNTNDPVTWYASNGAQLIVDNGQLQLANYTIGVPGAGIGDTAYLDLSAFGQEQSITVTAVAGNLASSYTVVRLDRSTAAAGATKNEIVYSSVEPANVTGGMLWMDTSIVPNVLRIRESGQWRVAANNSLPVSGFLETFEESDLSMWQLYSGSGSERSVEVVPDSMTGGRVLRIGNNSGDDHAWLIHKTLIPFDPAATYRVKFRVRRTAGAGTVYLGVAGVAANGTSLVNVTGLNSHSSQHYCAASNAAPTSSWTEYVGYIKGVAASGSTSAFPNLATPGVMHSSTRYLRPLLLVNHPNVAGITEVDFVSVENLTDALVWGNVVGAGKPADNATRNPIGQGLLSARPAGVDGEFYWATDTKIMYQKIAGAWQTTANQTTATSQLTDDANLGATANWQSIANLPEQDNLLRLGRFSTEYTGWTFPAIQASTAGLSAPVPGGITHVMRQTSRDNYEGSPVIPVSPGERIWISGFVNAEFSNFAVNAGIYGHIGQVAQSSWTVATISAALTPGWQQFKVSVLVPAGINGIKPFLQMNGTSGFGSVCYANLRWSRTEPGANSTSIDANGNIQGVSSGAGLSVANNQDSVIRAPGGGIFTTTTSSFTGSLKITLPQSWTSTMMKFTVDIFEYLTGHSCTLEIAGYNYNHSTNALWHNVTARVIGGSNTEYPVYFGHDGSKCCIYIGNANETWSYPQVRVRDFFAGYQGFGRTLWESGWAIGFSTATLTQVVGTPNSAGQYNAAVLDTLPGADWAKVSGANKPANNATRNVHRGDWVVSTAYAVGDTVIHGGYGWSCLTAHTSAAGVTPPTYPTVSNTNWTLASVKGVDARAAFLTASSFIFRIAQDGTVSPSSIALTAVGQSQTGDPTFSVTSGTATLTGTGATRTLTAANLTTDQATIRILWGGIEDFVTITKVREGANGISVVVSNEAHTLPSDNAGVVSSYTGSGTAIQVFEGGTALTASASATVSAFRVGTITQAPASTITAGAVSYAGTTATVAAHSAMVSGTDSVTLTIPITVYRADGSSTTINKTQTLSKAKAGVAGVNGTRTAILDMYRWSASAPTSFPSGTSTYTWATGQFTAPATANGWSLTPPAPVAGQTLWIARTIFADSGSSTTSSVTWNATVAVSLGAAGSNGAPGANGTRTAFLEVYRWSATAPTSFPSGTSTYTWATGAFTAPTTANGWSLTPGSAVQGQTLWACSVTRADTGTAATLSVTWNTSTTYAVGYAGSNGAPGEPGANGLNVATAYIYRRATSAPTLPSASATYTFATGAITGLNNSWTATVPSGTNPLWVSTAVASSASATASIAAAAWATPVVLAQNGDDGSPGSPGAAGLNSATVYLFRRTTTATAPALPSTSATYTFSTGGLSGHNNSWTTTMPTTGGAYRWMTLASAASTGATDTILASEWSAAALLAEDGAAGADGTDGLTVVVTNESHTVPASASGDAPSPHVGSGTTIQVYEGATPLSAVSSISANSQFTIGTPALSPASSITVGARSYSGTTATVAQHSAMSSSHDTVTITYPISIRRANGANVTINKAQTITKSKAGAEGPQGPVGQAGGGNILRNSSFEEFPATGTQLARNWLASTSSSSTHVATATYSKTVSIGADNGGFRQTVSSSAVTRRNGATIGVYQTNIPSEMLRNKTVTLSADIWGTTGESSQVLLISVDSGGNTTTVANATEAMSSGRVRRWATGVVPSSSVTLGAYLRRRSASASGSRATTSASGNGTTATIGFATQASAPYAVGSVIDVSGVTPTGYNGLKTVTACTTSSVSFASTTTGAQTVAGVINVTQNVTVHIDDAQLEVSDVPTPYRPSSVDSVGPNNQITSENVSTYIANAAIEAAQIGSIALVGTSNFSVKTSAETNVARMEMDSRAIKVFDAGGVLRVQLGDLTV